jgi:hypothetical protein
MIMVKVKITKKKYYAKLSRNANQQTSYTVGGSNATETRTAKVLSLRRGSELVLTRYGSIQRGMRFNEYFETCSRHFKSAYKDTDTVLITLYHVRYE